MSPSLWVVDTNVVVTGLLSGDAASPPAHILDAMLAGDMQFLICVELLAEYREVLLRKQIRSRHGLSEREVDLLIEALVTNAVVADISGRREVAPEQGDNHLSRLLAAKPGAGLITGDALLLRQPPPGARVITARERLEDRSRKASSSL